MLKHNKKLLAELKVLRENLLETNKLLAKAKQDDRALSLVRLEEDKYIANLRIKEIERIIYSEEVAS